MAKFIMHGTILEEPIRTKLSNGVDVVNVVIEERYQTAYKEVVNKYSVGFLGKIATAVPNNVRLCGSVVVIEGTITSHEYKGKCYYNLSGEDFTLISLKDSMGESFTEAELPLPEEDAEVLDTGDDDLPF